MLDRGTTLLYVSHTMPEVLRICQKAMWMDKGVIRMSGSAEEVCDAYLNEDK